MSSGIETETPCTPIPEVGLGRCLEIDDLVAMVEGALDTGRADAMLAHVDRCHVCAEVIANLGSLDGPARRVGRYQIERLLGTGGMGIVYAAFDPELQRRVAIKLVRPDSTSDSFQRLIMKEARTLARVNHPNVVGVYDVGEHAGEVYLATEFVDGVTLADWQVNREAPAIIDAWIQVARGLAAAHAEGVVHRDVKPANVLVGRDGRVRIGDFGIAHRASTTTGLAETLDSQPLVTNAVAGTPAYMAPEQKSGYVDARSDQFSTCVAIAEVLTGARPDADAVITVEPPELGAVLTRGLRSAPDERFRSMSDFADALARAIAPPRPRALRRYALAAAVAAGAAGIIAVVAVRQAGSEAGCRAGTVPDAVWPGRRREVFARNLRVDMSPYLERWLTRWSTASADVCVTSHDPEVRARRTRCLEHAMTRFSELLARWEATMPASTFGLFVGLDELPHPAWCSNAAAQVSREPPPEQAVALASIEDELTTPREPAQARAALEQLLTRARALGDAALVRRVAVALANQQAPEAAIATLRAAIASGPDDFSSVVVTLELLGRLGAAEIDEIDALVASTRARILALGGDLALESELDLRFGQVLGTTERHDDAIAALERALQSARTAYGDGSPQEAQVQVSLAGAYYGRDGVTSRRGRAAAKEADVIWARNAITMPSAVLATSTSDLLEQLKHLEAIALETGGPRSEAMFDALYAQMNGYVLAEQPELALDCARRANELGQQLGIRSARTPYVLAQIAGLLDDLNRPDEALPYARDAVASAQALDLADELASARSILGRTLIAIGDPAAARAPLVAALRHLSGANREARFRGRTRFLLAVARWPTEPTPALDDARVARAELESFATTPEADVTLNPIGAPFLQRQTARFVAEIDGWLRERSK